jgi:prepilin-type N-terminal cleavage/methylation domain-containing protein
MNAFAVYFDPLGIPYHSYVDKDNNNPVTPGKSKDHYHFSRIGIAHVNCNPGNRIDHHPMKRVQSKHSSENGFTLIEVIATIIVMGILAAFFIHFMGTALNDSWKAVEVVEGEAKAEGLMERIIAEYVELINGNNPDAALATILSLESSYESDPDYGLPVTMQYIVFDTNGDEQPDTAGENRNLKVTVEPPGFNLTTILTQSRTATSDPPVIW